MLPSKIDKSIENLETSIGKITPETILSIFQYTAPQHRMKLKFAIETGLRAGEQVALRVLDKKKPELGGVDFKANVVKVRIAKKRGADYTRCMELMGHADMSTTLMYKKHVENAERDEADAKAGSGTYGLDLNIDAPSGSDEPQDNIVAMVATG